MTNPILTKEQAKFLEGQNISTFKGKFEVISKALEANNAGSDGFSINTEKEYEEFLTAVIIGIDAKKLYSFLTTGNSLFVCRDAATPI